MEEAKKLRELQFGRKEQLKELIETTKTSTQSLGRFDQAIKNDIKLKAVKKAVPFLYLCLVQAYWVCNGRKGQHEKDFDKDHQKN